ncbi:MAG: DMT family transporter [Ahrensia sp.]|nr:DMT family transporter [Ahrensia sp.]
MKSWSPNAQGAAFMMLAMAGYVLNDALMKLVLEKLPFFQSLFIRGIFASIFLLALCWHMRVISQAIVSRLFKDRNVRLRVVAEVGGTYFFLTALSHMPIANVTAVLQILPLTVTLMAAWLLGEKVGLPRYLAIFAGFAGVVLILRPGTSEFDVYAIYALIAVAFITLRDLVTRRMDVAIPTLPVSLLTAIAIMGFGGVGMLFQPTRLPSAGEVALLAAAAGILNIGYIFSISTMRVGDVSFVSPFRYSILIFALIIGFFLFGDVPDLLAVIGSIVVVASGLFAFYRERLVARRREISAASNRASSRNH